MDNIVLFTGLIATGTIICFFLLYTGKKETTQQPRHLPSWTFFSVSISVITLAYLCRLLLMILLGIYTQLDLIVYPTIIFALLPIIFIIVYPTLQQRKQEQA